MKKLKLLPLFLFFTVFITCGQPEEKPEDVKREDLAVEPVPGRNGSYVDEIVGNEAIADIESKSGSNVTGLATFTDLGAGGITFNIAIHHATPGKHAVHLHETGDCSAPDASSAGGHWNPSGVKHGKRGTDAAYHRGDIANIEVGMDSTGALSMTVLDWTIGGPDSTNILNKAVIIHAKTDDFTSQPSGAAGDRVGCGVIKLK